MISLTRLTGERFALNPDLIEGVEARHHTVVTLVDGAKYLVAEAWTKSPIGCWPTAWRWSAGSCWSGVFRGHSSSRRDRARSVDKLEARNHWGLNGIRPRGEPRWVLRRPLTSPNPAVQGATRSPAQRTFGRSDILSPQSLAAGGTTRTAQHTD
jgi:hypothetical protein